MAAPAAAPAAPRLVGSGHVGAGPAVALRPLASGTLVELRVAVGDVFKTGDVLARLASDEADMAVVTAEARLREAELAHAISELERNRAETLLARAEASAGAGIVPARIAADAVLDLRAATAQAALAAQAVTLAALERDAAAAELERTILRAPFDGVVIERLAAPGAFVASPRDGGPGDAILRVLDPTRLRVVVELGETRISDIAVGQAATAELEAWPGAPLAMKVAAIVPEISRQKSTITVVLRFARLPARGRILPNMAVRVDFDTVGDIDLAGLPGRAD